MAGERVRTLITEFKGNTSGLQKAANTAQRSMGKVQGATGRLTGALGRGGRALGGFGQSFAGAFGAGLVLQAPQIIGSLSSRAAELELQMKKVNTVFGGNTAVLQENLKQIEVWSKDVAPAMGLSSRAVQALAANTADLLVPMGFARVEATNIATKTTELSAALAEWSGGSIDATQASEILTKAYLGERDALTSLGIKINEADVQARLLEKGQQDLTGQMLEQAKATATMELIFEKSEDAQAAFANGAGTAARQQKILASRLAELKDTIALRLMPTLVQAADFVLTKWWPVFQTGLEAIKPIFEFIINNKPVMIAAIVAIGAVIATTLGPASLAIAAIVGLITAIGYLKQHWQEIKDAVIGYMTELRDRIGRALNDIERWLGPLGFLFPLFKFRDEIAQALLWIGDQFSKWVRRIGSHFDSVIGFIQSVIDKIQTLIDWVGRIPSPGDIAGGVGGFVGGLLPFDSGGVVPGPLGAPVPILAHGGETVLPTHRRGGGFGGTLNVYVTQPLGTPDEVASAVLGAILHLEDSGSIIEIAGR